MTNTKQNKKLKKRPIVPNTSFIQEDVRSDGIAWVLIMCALVFLMFYF